MSKLTRPRTRAPKPHPYLDGGAVDWSKFANITTPKPILKSPGPYTPTMQLKGYKPPDRDGTKRTLEGTGVIKDTFKKVGKAALKYGAPVVAGLAAAAGAHYLTKGKPPAQAVNPIEAFNGGKYDSSRYSDHSLPFADTVTPSSYRHRDQVDNDIPLNSNSIRGLLAIQALHSAFDPSVNHQWPTYGGSLIGTHTLVALAEGHQTTDPKIYHLMKCKHCQGAGIGKTLWNGIKKVGKEVYGGVKAVGKEVLPYAVPVALAAGTAAAAYHGIPKIPGVTKGVPGIKHGIEAAKDFDLRGTLSEAARLANHNILGNDTTNKDKKTSGHRSKTYDHLDYFA